MNIATSVFFKQTTDYSANIRGIQIESAEVVAEFILIAISISKQLPSPSIDCTRFISLKGALGMT